MLTTWTNTCKSTKKIMTMSMNKSWTLKTSLKRNTMMPKEADVHKDEVDLSEADREQHKGTKISEPPKTRMTICIGQLILGWGLCCKYAT